MDRQVHRSCAVPVPFCTVQPATNGLIPMSGGRSDSQLPSSECLTIMKGVHDPHLSQGHRQAQAGVEGITIQ